MLTRRLLTIGLLAGTFAVAACSGDDSSGSTNTGGSSGTGGSSSTGGSSGTGGGSSTGGHSGTGGGSTGGSSGTGGSGNTGGSGDTGGSGGSDDDAGTGGSSADDGGTDTDGGGSGGGSPEGCLTGGTFTLTSKGFDMQSDGLHFVTSAQHYADNSDHAPDFAWTGAPAGTKSFALSLMDTQGLSKTESDWKPKAHWVLWNIPATTCLTPQDLEHKSPVTMPPDLAGAEQTNLKDKPAYFGPGADARLYVFEIWALNVDKLPNDTNSKPVQEIRNSLSAISLGKAQLVAEGHKN